jgi:flagellar biosynthesis GTPase FlhF
MSKVNETPWIDSVIRESKIRKALLIHGNLSDISFDSGSNSYETVTSVISSTLKKNGFDEVVVWDRIDGMQNIGSKRKNELIDSSTKSENDEDSSDSDFDLGDEAADENNADSVPATNDPNQFFPIVLQKLRGESKTKTAFIIDWSHYLFGNVNSLIEEEREWLTILSKAVRDAKTEMSRTEIEKPSNLVILLANNLANVPPLFYQNNPSVKQVSIPNPSRTDRELFVKNNLIKFRFEKDMKPSSSEFNDFVDSLDGMTLRDIQQLIKLSRQTTPVLSYDKLINLYKYGEKISPWEKLSKDKLKETESRLQKRVLGQDEAIKKVRDVIIRAYTGLAGIEHSGKQSKPKGALFFVGPTGVGKTELAKALADFLFGDETACIRFDMSEFNHEHSDQRLIGAPPGYVGFEEGGQLTNAIREKPFSVILFDEIEKAHGRILDKFLQILEDGRLTDGKGETVYFSESVIIFTSNIGASKINVSDDIESVKKEFKKEVKEHFIKKLGRPELLNRIGDNIVSFNHIIDTEFLSKIASIKMDLLKNKIKEQHDMELYFENKGKALKAIADAVDKAQGGRGVINVIQPNIVNPLSEFIFERTEEFSPGKKIKIVQAGNTARFDFELE